MWLLNSFSAEFASLQIRRLIQSFPGQSVNGFLSLKACISSYWVVLGNVSRALTAEFSVENGQQAAVFQHVVRSVLTDAVTGGWMQLGAVAPFLYYMNWNALKVPHNAKVTLPLFSNSNVCFKPDSKRPGKKRRWKCPSQKHVLHCSSFIYLHSFMWG